ncbi:MAG: hypothetical protein JNL82_00735 [Myxococcales bacterium]|nr:hypothetical protein [Myxococcales bacterium]
MNDENTQKNKDGEHPRVDEVHHEDASGVLLIDRPVKPGTLELKGPPGMAVQVVGDQWSTKIVLIGFQSDEGRHGRHGHADDRT